MEYSFEFNTSWVFAPNPELSESRILTQIKYMMATEADTKIFDEQEFVDVKKKRVSYTARVFFVCNF